MPLHRRDVLLGGLAASALPFPAVAQLDLGDARLLTLRDGHLTLPRTGPLPGIPEAEYEAILTRHGVTGDTLTPPCNVTLFRTGDRTVLFDVGGGSEFMSSVGRLPDALAAADTDPGEVTDVVFTHAHPDHLWGLLDDFGDLAFPDAQFHIGRAEWDYWMRPDTLDTIGEARLAFAVGAQRRLEAIADKVAFFEDGQTVLPGVEAVATFGHTPGHMAFLVADGDAGAMVLGDAVINDHVAFVRPDWPLPNDQDPQAAAGTRVALLDRLAADDLPVVGFHLPGDGIGRVQRADEGYRFQPDGG